MNVSGTTVSATGHKGGLGDGLYDKAGARPDLDLDFARTKSLKDRVSKEDLITFTRGSGTGYGATYVDGNGLVKVAPVNIMPNSSDLSTSSFTAISPGQAGDAYAEVVLATDQGTAPDGSSAGALKGTGETARHTLRMIPTSQQSNTQYVMSIFIKKLKGTTAERYVQLETAIWGTWATTGSSGAFDLDTGTRITNPSSGISSGIEDYGNGWYRIYFVATTATATSSTGFYVNAVSSGNATGSTTLASDEGFLVWGAQMEVGSVPTTYIPTSGQVSGAPRFTHDPVTKESKGLLIEQESINYITYSEDFTQGWTDFGTTGAGISLTRTNDASVTNPSGTAGATKVVVTRTNHTNQFRAIRHPAISRGVTDQSTVSFWIKAATTSDVGKSVSVWQHDDGDFRLDVKLTLTNDWVRHIFIASSTNGYVNEPLNIGLVQSTTSAGTNNTEMSVGYYVWGAQFENGTLGTSYIPTSGSTVTRSPDLASIQGDNFGTYRTNLQTNSENFSDSSIYPVQQTMVQDYAGVSPTGNYDASLWTATTTQNIGHTIRTLALANIETGATYTVTVHAKPTATEDTFYMNFGTHDGSTGTNEGGMKFQLTGDGVLIPPNSGAASSSSIDKLANGWYRCRLTTNALSQNTNAKVFIKIQKNGSFVAANPPEALLIWGLQVEKNSTMTEYIPSTDKFTNRQSNATFVDGNGIIRTSYANHLKYSEQLDQAAWVKSGGTSITSNNVVAPDGTTTADTWSHDSTRYGFYNNTEGDWMSAHSQLLYPFTITDEWVRYSISLTTESGQSSMRVYPLRTNNNLDYVFQTDIVVTQNTDYVFSAWYKKVGTKVYVWGCQLVKGSEAGDYHKTTGTISGPPRYSHDPETLTPTGLYLEAKSTNDAIDTERFGSAFSGNADLDPVYIAGPYHYSSSTRKTETGITNPDGSTDGTTVLTVNSGTHNRQQPRGLRLPNIASLNGRSVQSVFVKRKTSTARYVVLFLGGTGTYQQCLFDFDTETVVENTAPHNLADHQQYNATDRMVGRGVVKYPNGWYRLYLIIDTPAVIAGNGYGVGLAKDPATSKSANLTDDGPYDGTEAIYVWGLNRCSAEDVDSNNVPQETHLSSYIKNLQVTTSSVNRTPDIFTSTATEVLDRANGTKPAFYTTDGLSIFTKFKLNNQRPTPTTSSPNLSTHSYKPIWQLATSTSNVEVTLMPDLNASNGTPRFVAYRNSDPKTMFAARQFTQDADVKSILRYLPDDNSAGSVKNRLVSNDGTIVPNGTNDVNGHTPLKAILIHIGNNVGGNVQMYGTINRLTFWKTPFSDEKLLKITS